MSMKVTIIRRVGEKSKIHLGNYWNYVDSKLIGFSKTCCAY